MVAHEGAIQEEMVIEVAGEEEIISKWVRSKRCPIWHCKTSSRITLTSVNEHLKNRKLITQERQKHKPPLFLKMKMNKRKKTIRVVSLTLSRAQVPSLVVGEVVACVNVLIRKIQTLLERKVRKASAIRTVEEEGVVEEAVEVAGSEAADTEEVAVVTKAKAGAERAGEVKEATKAVEVAKMATTRAEVGTAEASVEATTPAATIAVGVVTIPGQQVTPSQTPKERNSTSRSSNSSSSSETTDTISLNPDM